MSMHPAVTLNGLSLFPSTDAVLPAIDLSVGPGRTGLVGRNGSGKSTLLSVIAGQRRPFAGQIVVSGTVALMRQDDQAHVTTIADLFGISPALDLLARTEAGLATADDLAAADWTLPSRIAAALARTGLVAAPDMPLAALSGGQRTRAALAAALLANPDILLLDEPTNTLDAAGRAAVAEILGTWPGIAIVASHDRALLDQMDAIVELSSLGAQRYGGGFSAYQARKATELAAVQHDLDTATQARDDAARRARIASERKARRDGAGHRARAKGDQPRIAADFAKGRAEASGGAGDRLRAARGDAAAAALDAARARIEVLTPIAMDVPASGLPAGKTVLRLESVTGGHGGHATIRDLSLVLTGPARVVIAGPNGSGKSTMLDLVTGALVPAQGQAGVLVPFARLDQNGALLPPQLTLRDAFLHLHPAADAHATHVALARFGFRAADALRRVDQLSGGERVRAGLACTLGAMPVPMLLILDEPTNHLDLDGIAALESALAGYDGAVLAVSHDPAFLRALAPDRVVTLSPDAS